MILKAVIVKSTQKRINDILKKGNIYAAAQANGNLSSEIRFYKNEESARKNYLKKINGIFHIEIDTENMQFFGENETTVTSLYSFTETDTEYIFTFDYYIKDLHYHCPTLKNTNTENTPKQISTQESHMTDEIIITKMEELSQSINYEPTNIAFIQKAMYCQGGKKEYTVGDFAILGDAVLKLVLTEHLFDKGYNKAKITQLKQKLEDNGTLYDLCECCGIYKFAYNDSHFFEDAPQEGRLPHSNHDDYIEAIIAAIYKDKGLAYCKEWVISFFKKYNIPVD